MAIVLCCRVVTSPTPLINFPRPVNKARSGAHDPERPSPIPTLGFNPFWYLFIFRI